MKEVQDASLGIFVSYSYSKCTLSTNDYGTYTCFRINGPNISLVKTSIKLKTQTISP